MYVYLSRIYVKDSITYAIEIVKFNDINSIKFETIYKDKIYKRLKEIEEKEKCFLDFTYTKDNEVSVRKLLDRVNIMSLRDLPKQGEVVPEVLPSLYSLLFDLCDAGSGYCYDLDELNKEVYLPSFNQIRVSESTMSISVPMHDSENGWFSKSIVAVDDDGCFVQKPFYCLISQDDGLIAKKYKLEDCGECEHNGNKFHIYKYNCGLPLCDSIGRYVFCGALICHYKVLQDTFGKVIQSLRYFVKKMTDYDKSDKSTSPSSAFKRINPRGCYFKLVGRDTSRDFGEVMFQQCSMLRKDLSERNVPLDDKTFDILFEDSNFPLAAKYSIKILNDVFNHFSNSPYDSLDLANSYLDCYRKLYMKICLYLYNVRVSCLFNQAVSYKFRLFNRFPVEGSIFNSQVEIVIK